MEAAIEHQLIHPAPGIRQTILYIAIGCAQGHYPVGEHSAQQYPPFLSAWSPATARILLLVDPALEDPPRVYDDIPTRERLQTTVYCHRTSWDWSHYSPSCEFLQRIIHTVLTRPDPTYLIVQDYTGHDINQEYRGFLRTTRFTEEHFLSKILFDPSYDGPGCFPDLRTPVLRDPITGDFVQPSYTTLRRLVSARPPPTQAILDHQVETRSARIRYYAARLLRGELRTDQIAQALEHIQFFVPIVGFTPTPDPGRLRLLITETLRDFGSVARPPREYTEEEIASLLTDGNALSRELFTLNSLIHAPATTDT